MLALIVAASELPAAPVVGLMAAGVLVGIAGHVAGSPRTVGAGIAVLFVATALMILGAFFAFQDDSGDPRPQGSPSQGRF